MICDKRIENIILQLKPYTSQHVEFFHSLIFSKNPEISLSSRNNPEMSQCSLDVPIVVKFSIYISMRSSLNWVVSFKYMSHFAYACKTERKKWNFPLNFRTMRKLSDLWNIPDSSSGCVSGLDHFRNFTNLKILNI